MNGTEAIPAGTDGSSAVIATELTACELTFTVTCWTCALGAVGDRMDVEVVGAVVVLRHRHGHVIGTSAGR